MSGDESALALLLGANARTLLRGQPVNILRRRLKLASLMFDRAYLEAGILTITAGSQGSSTFHDPASEDEPPTWQAPAERATKRKGGFRLSIGVEEVRGVPPTEIHEFLTSDTIISWRSTLEPFIRELPRDCDWVEFFRLRELPPVAEKYEKDWSFRDSENPALHAAIPERFLRSLAIKHANRSLAVSGVADMAVALDSFHVKVPATRLSENGNVRGSGYAAPVIFPDVGDLSWETISDIRRNRSMARFRRVLREVEQEALRDAGDGDVERAVHRAYERHLAEASGELDGVFTALKRMAIGFALGLAAGTLTSGLTGVTGILAGAGVGTGIGLPLDVYDIAKSRRRRAWISLHEQLDSLTGTSPGTK